MWAASGPPVIQPLINKLERLGRVSLEARQMLASRALSVTTVAADQDLSTQGGRADECHLLLDGFACSYRALANGGRQILCFHIAGDLCGLDAMLLETMDYSVCTLANSRVATISQADIEGWMQAHPDLARLLWLDTLLDAATYREWVVNIGRRSAYQRVAHLLCELATRLRAAGLAKGRGCDLPVTQAELADATGLSAVHVNRTVQALRRDGLIELRGAAFLALDWEGLKRAAGFDPTYLHQLAGPAA